MFSKKATKIDEIFTVDLTLCSKCQINGEYFVIFCGLLRKHELYNLYIFRGIIYHCLCSRNQCHCHGRIVPIGFSCYNCLRCPTLFHDSRQQHVKFETTQSDPSTCTLTPRLQWVQSIWKTFQSSYELLSKR